MKFLAFCIGMLIFCSTSVQAIECGELNKKSNAYQTCMLRKENAERQNKLDNDQKVRNEIEERNRKEMEATASDVEGWNSHTLKIQNLLALSEVVRSENPRLTDLDVDPKFTECQIVLGEFSSYVLAACKKSVLLLFTVNQSNFAQEVVTDIKNKKIEAVFVGGIFVPITSNNLTTTQHNKGVAAYIDMTKATTAYNEIFEKMKNKQPIELYFKGERKSTKILLSEYKQARQ